MDKTNIIEFLLSSINDIQSTIRAIDAKIIAIIVIIILPFTSVELMVKVFCNSIKMYTVIGYIFIPIYIVAWLACLLFAFLCLLSINNPTKEIKNNIDVKGFFYGPILCKSKKPNLKKYIRNFKTINIENELLFEQMKLVYIRDKKIKRQKIALIAALIVLFINFICWINYCIQTIL